LSALDQLPVRAGIPQISKNPKFFALKTATIRIWRTPLVRTGLTPPPDCGRLLWTAPPYTNEPVVSIPTKQPADKLEIFAITCFSTRVVP